MENLFIALYHFFRKRRVAFWATLAVAILAMAWGAVSINIEEDISKFFPDDDRVEKLNYVFRNAKFSERVIAMVSVADSAREPLPDSLVAVADRYAAALERGAADFIDSIQVEIDDTQLFNVVGTVQQYLPVFLEEGDYVAIDSLLSRQGMRTRLKDNYRQLVAPSSVVTKNIIANDPLGISYIVLAKLQQLQVDQNIEVYESHLISKDHRHLFFFITPRFKPNETGPNSKFLDHLETIAAEVSTQDIKASYFGAPLVAAGNAKQIQRDTMVTVSIMLVLLAIFILGYFRRKRVPFLILFPVIFGALFALCMINLLQSNISVIAIAAGSMILGIAVNYSLHFLSHLRHAGNVEEVIKDLVKPMTLGSATTVLAFLCLQFVNASVLRDVGLFAAFSLIGAALCTLVVLPQLISVRYISNQPSGRPWIERVASYSFENSKVLLIVIVILTPLFFYFAGSVKFNTDLAQLNFMSDELRASQMRLESINQSSLASTYLISQASSLEHGLRKNERITSEIKALFSSGDVQKFSSPSTLIISDSLQQIRIRRWENFWATRAEKARSLIREEGAAFGFSQRVFQNFDSLIAKKHLTATPRDLSVFRKVFFDHYFIEKDGLVTVITLANISPQKKEDVFNKLNQLGMQAFDRQMLTNLFVEYIHDDFNFIVTVTGAIVFIALLLIYGRIELTLMTFVPMLITWIWILGLMALVGIEFNIVNVMISTFIFGLGDDYSIFTMDGLLRQYEVGKANLLSIRTSVLLSALTTISGLGVLIFASHPALRSIAAISIIGIICVFFMSQTLQPFLFRWLITSRTSRGFAPMTAWGILKTTFTYSFFVAGSFLLTVIGVLIKLFPFVQSSKRLLYHRLISAFTGSLVRLSPQLKVTKIDFDQKIFSRANVLIANHSSFLDILLTTMLHPKLILLTNQWVWNSPVFGGVVRLADYYPVMEGAEDSIEKVRSRVLEGYSIVIFPEGTRSPDGKIKRFHKGAFYIAEVLKLPIVPLIIHGANDAIPKSTMYLNTGPVTLKFLPAIEPGDASFGSTYSERAKRVGRYFRSAHDALSEKQQTPAYFRYRLLANYIYKGPVLEWYARIKVALEGNYEQFNTIVPQRGKILDLGCGYGFLCYMLSFLSEERTLTGIDYDEQKIETAKHCFSESVNLTFEANDITAFKFDRYDAIIIADVLHYLTPADQTSVIMRSIEALNVGGILIIRDGNAELKNRHKGTEATEFFSVKLLKFNKSVNDLHFIHGSEIERIAAHFGCLVETIDDAKFTSNVIFVIRKQESLAHAF